MRTNYVPPARTLILELDGVAISGIVRTCLSDELVVSLPRGTVLPIGRHLDLMVSGGKLRQPLGVRGLVRRRVEARDGRLYGVAHEMTELAGHIPSPALPERRRWARTTARQEVPVVLSANGENAAGYLIDVSAGGIGLRMARNVEGAMSEHQTAEVFFVPPGCEHQVNRSCRIRSRVLGGSGLRYGLRFDVPDVNVQFEALWRCGRCGQEDLLATSQPHCPDCGRLRGNEKTYLPEWDQLTSVGGHRFTGDGASCKACGSLWSDKAAHCGQCGSTLI